MVWDSTNIPKAANKQGFFRNKEAVAEKPNLTSTAFQNQPSHNNAPDRPQARLQQNQPQQQQGQQQQFYQQQVQQQQQVPSQNAFSNNKYSPGSDLSQSPTSNERQPRTVGAKSASSEVTDKITGARLWSKDSANRVFPQEDGLNNSPQLRRANNRSNSVPASPQDQIFQHRPDPLPVGYDPRASLSNSANNSSARQAPPFAPSHLPPLGSSPLVYAPRRPSGDLNTSMNNQAPHGAYATVPITNGGYTALAGGGINGPVMYMALPQISPVPSNDLVQMVLRNYEEAQRSYLSVR
eukprot:GILI01026020.1.p1 GENE.GILI01026020.1~~GILI01026020.1.p1  ORF type:complete len:295 (+),score=51.07 GILI01026020.1:140-1024(+)